MIINRNISPSYLDPPILRFIKFDVQIEHLIKASIVSKLEYALLCVVRGIKLRYKPSVYVQVNNGLFKLEHKRTVYNGWPFLYADCFKKKRRVNLKNVVFL